MIEKNILKYKIMVQLLEYMEQLNYLARQAYTSERMETLPAIRTPRMDYAGSLVQRVADNILEHVDSCHYVTKEEHARLFMSDDNADRIAALRVSQGNAP